MGPSFRCILSFLRMGSQILLHEADIYADTKLGLFGLGIDAGSAVPDWL